MHNPTGVNRRDAIKISGAVAALGLGNISRARAATPAAPEEKPFRLAHITDTHIEPERRAPQGVAACLAHMMALDRAPDLVITGGDHVFDSNEATRERTQLQWDLHTSVFRDGCPIETHHCLGNHDIWGWNKSKSATTGAEPQWGKRWAQDILAMDAPYYALDKGAWRFIVLDSVFPDGPDGYIGKLDDEQFDWLERTLRDTPAPGAPNAKWVCVVSHIPILSTAALFAGKPAEPLKMRPGLTMSDANRIHPLLARHGGVRLCISGHIHQLDRAEYEGLTYICDGAVSGNWWKGRFKTLDEGFGVIDFHTDGTFKHDYLKYGWKAEG